MPAPTAQNKPDAKAKAAPRATEEAAAAQGKKRVHDSG
jgi:hypothetical protein